MPQDYPHFYEVQFHWKENARGTISAPPRRDLEVGPPPQFDGLETDWSPEHLLMAALNSCLMTTFKALVNRSQLEIKKYEGTARGKLEKTREGLLFTEFSLKAEIAVPAEQKEKAESLIQAAKKYCLVSNALKVEPSLEFSVTGV